LERRAIIIPDLLMRPLLKVRSLFSEGLTSLLRLELLKRAYVVLPKKGLLLDETSERRGLVLSFMLSELNPLESLLDCN
jgi:hypothetical protein